MQHVITLGLLFACIVLGSLFAYYKRRYGYARQHAERSERWCNEWRTQAINTRHRLTLLAADRKRPEGPDYFRAVQDEWFGNDFTQLND